MQPYIPYIVLEALSAEREREIERLNHQSAFPLSRALGRRIGILLVRLGTRLQTPVTDPLPKAV